MKHRFIFIFLAFWTMTLFSIPSMAGTISGKINARGLRVPSNVVVYLTKVPDAAKKASSKKYILDQKDLSFIPHVLVVPAGVTVEFPNNDKVDHNVFSLSRTKNFNLGTYKPGQTKTVTFEKPGVVELRCDMHAEMAGFILVMKNTYYGITDKSGNFTINTDQLPPGKYKIRTWHEKLKSSSKTIELSAGGDLALDLKLKRGTPGKLYKR